VDAEAAGEFEEDFVHVGPAFKNLPAAAHPF
jgi:hypothetical protein